MSALKKALTAIAEGYPVKVHDDRYICVENPDYRPDNGADPNLLIDVTEVPQVSEANGLHSPAPVQGEALEKAKAIRGFIAALDDDLFGQVEPQNPDETGWPVRDELVRDVDLIVAALSSPLQERESVLEKRPYAFCVEEPDGRHLYFNEELCAYHADKKSVEYFGLYRRMGAALSKPQPVESVPVGLRSLVQDFADDLGMAEWVSPEHAQEILVTLIHKFHSPARALLASPPWQDKGGRACALGGFTKSDPYTDTYGGTVTDYARGTDRITVIVSAKSLQVLWAIGGQFGEHFSALSEASAERERSSFSAGKGDQQ